MSFKKSEQVLDPCVRWWALKHPVGDPILSPSSAPRPLLPRPSPPASTRDPHLAVVFICLLLSLRKQVHSTCTVGPAGPGPLMSPIRGFQTLPPQDERVSAAT